MKSRNIIYPVLGSMFVTLIPCCTGSHDGNDKEPYEPKLVGIVIRF